MSNIAEIAPNVFRISVFADQFNLEFNHFLVIDDEPLLFHTGMRRMFPDVRAGVEKIISPSKLRWISFSHFEVDECGALNEWLAAAPHAQPMCSLVGAMVNLSDFSNSPPRGLTRNDVVHTGAHRFRFISTPHLPHGWDAGVLFEETNRTLFCSDLFHQEGRRDPVTASDVVEESREAMIRYQAGPLMDYMPYTPQTRRKLGELAALNPKTLAIMHGASFTGDCPAQINRLADVMQEVLGNGNSAPMSM